MHGVEMKLVNTHTIIHARRVFDKANNGSVVKRHWSDLIVFTYLSSVYYSQLLLASYTALVRYCFGRTC